MLYVLPTPIGNLDDLSYRAKTTLETVDLILAEDTRNTIKLHRHYNIEKPIQSYHAHNEHKKTPEYIDQLKEGKTIALVSDAGTPGISDPGFMLVRACHDEKIPVSVLPGPTALIPALVASGIPCDKFYFEGFLPHKKGRKSRLEYLAELPFTFALYESPHRLLRCLKELSEHCGPDRLAAVCREISKLYEENRRDTLGALLDYFTNEGKVKGEFVIVVAGKG